MDPEQYPALAESAGLQTMDLTVDDVRWEFGSREAFTRWCTVGFADWTARLSADDVGAWVDEVVQAYEPIAGGPGEFRFLQLHAEMTPTT